jgi:hypothetical protein
VNCVQIELSGNRWLRRLENQQFSWHDATVGQRKKTIYPFAALEFEVRCHDDLACDKRFQTAPADACV